MKNLYKICLSAVFVITGLALVAEQQGFGAKQDTSAPNQQRRLGWRDVWSFEKDKAGSVPQGWKVAETRGKGTLATWQVIRDDSAPNRIQVVAITANKNGGSTYNLLIAQDTSYRDLAIKVMVKAGTGRQDQGGGPIWWAKDGGNYYICRWNPLEDNFRLYYVKDSRRRQLGSADVRTDTSVWHEIRIVHKDTQITASFDGKKMLELQDTTFSEPGMVGLWVKADGRTAFDDFSARCIYFR